MNADPLTPPAGKSRSVDWPGLVAQAAGAAVATLLPQALVWFAAAASATAGYLLAR